ncbi:MAG TPA: hypothetical protein DCR97_10755 [Deltaproteobacteria bacterium]|nr:hypothetical protein [Deltaproteobacteria bacterium]
MIKFIRNLFLATAVPKGEEKLKNAIAFFASEYERLMHEPLAVSSLHKYLALLDHASSERLGHPALGLLHRTRGKVLTDPYESRKTGKHDCFMVIQKQGRYAVKATKDPELSYFSSFELNVMKRLVEVNADRLGKVLHSRFSSFEQSEMKKGGADDLEWARNRDDTRERAWAEIKSAVMDVSERNFFTQHKEVDEMTGLRLLIEKYETRLSELEAEMAEVKRKMETVKEALHLLKEEGLLEDEPKPRWP